jgi:hypothetical protein
VAESGDDGVSGLLVCFELECGTFDRPDRSKANGNGALVDANDAKPARSVPAVDEIVAPSLETAE